MPPPYGIIANRLRDGQVVPFLGAGASFFGRPADAVWNPAAPAFLPSGLELARLLAGEAGLSEDDTRDLDDLAKVSSYYVDQGGRGELRRQLRKVFTRAYSPGPLHTLLASVTHPQVIVATNYDTLVEQAFRSAGRPYDLVVYPADRKEVANATLWWKHGAGEPIVCEPNKLDIDLSTTTVIYKMHGSVVADDAAKQWDSFVITEEDYIEFLSRMTTNTAIPSIFYPHFRERSFLFLGYSLRDWNLRVVLNNLSRDLNRRAAADADDVPPSWSVQRQTSTLERELWKHRGVKIFDVPLDEFVAQLAAELRS